jgi:hypothetical protein
MYSGFVSKLFLNLYKRLHYDNIYLLTHYNNIHLLIMELIKKSTILFFFVAILFALTLTLAAP